MWPVFTLPFPLGAPWSVIDRDHPVALDKETLGFGCLSFIGAQRGGRNGCKLRDVPRGEWIRIETVEPWVPIGPNFNALLE